MTDSKKRLVEEHGSSYVLKQKHGVVTAKTNTGYQPNVDKLMKLTNTGNGYIAKFYGLGSVQQDYFVCLDYAQAEYLMQGLAMQHDKVLVDELSKLIERTERTEQACDEARCYGGARAGGKSTLDRIWFDEIKEAPKSNVVAMPEPDADGWYTWGADGEVRKSSDHPWLDADTYVEVQLRSGYVDEETVGFWDWSVSGTDSGDIMRYRVIVNPKQEVPAVPEAPATESEPKWLPAQQEGFGPWIEHNGDCQIPELVSSYDTVTWLLANERASKTHDHFEDCAAYVDWSYVVAYAIKKDSTEGANAEKGGE
jgi:hypothetical protein